MSVFLPIGSNAAESSPVSITADETKTLVLTPPLYAGTGYLAETIEVQRQTTNGWVTIGALVAQQSSERVFALRGAGSYRVKRTEQGRSVGVDIF